MCDEQACDLRFASRSVPRHLARGVLGLGLLLASFVLVPATGALSLFLALPAVYALRGCPSCWLVGLIQTRARPREQPHDHAPERPREQDRAPDRSPRPVP